MNSFRDRVARRRDDVPLERDGPSLPAAVGPQVAARADPGVLEGLADLVGARSRVVPVRVTTTLKAAPSWLRGCRRGHADRAAEHTHADVALIALAARRSASTWSS